MISDRVKTATFRRSRASDNGYLAANQAQLQFKRIFPVKFVGVLHIDHTEIFECITWCRDEVGIEKLRKLSEQDKASLVNFVFSTMKDQLGNRTPEDIEREDIEVALGFVEDNNHYNDSSPDLSTSLPSSPNSGDKTYSLDKLKEELGRILCEDLENAFITVYYKGGRIGPKLVEGLSYTVVLIDRQCPIIDREKIKLLRIYKETLQFEGFKRPFSYLGHAHPTFFVTWDRPKDEGSFE